MEYKMRSFLSKYYLIFITLLIVLFGGCSSSLPQINEGSFLSNSEIAQVKCTSYIKKIIDLDGKNMTEIKRNLYTGNSKLTLLPGKHIMTVVFTTNEERTITFTVEAGKSYELNRWGDNAVLIDLQNKKTWSEYQKQLYKGITDELIDKQIKSFIAPTPSTNDVIVRSLEHVPAVQLISIDNKKYTSTNPGFALRLAPGQHTFEFWVSISRGFFQQDRYTPETEVISVELEPGCTYVIYSRVIDFKSNEVATQVEKDICHSVLSEYEKPILDEKLASKSVQHEIAQPTKEEKVETKQVKNAIYGFPWKFDDLSTKEQKTAIKLGYTGSDTVYMNKPFGGMIIPATNQPQIIVKKITYLDNELVFYGIINLAVTYTIDVEEVERQGFEVADVWVEISDEGRQLKYIDKSQVP